MSMHYIVVVGKDTLWAKCKNYDMEGNGAG